MYFCPFCATLLLLERAGGEGGSMRYACSTCTFISPVRNAQSVATSLVAKNKRPPELDDFAQALSDKGKPTTAARCVRAECGGTQAFYVQQQIRSADEPPTTFYQCTTCGSRWRTD
jgi:DNA-directed RNA polymerase subunit M/transcription elongation factor TFIIS